MLATDLPFRQYADVTGLPLDGGYLYFGQPNQNPETAPITVYWDDAGTQPAAQPIRTLKGFPVRNGNIANVFCGVEYSLAIKNAKGELVCYRPASKTLFTQSGAGLIGLIPSGISAVGDGLTPARAAIQLAIDTIAAAGGGRLIIPRGVFSLDASLVLKAGVFLDGEGAEFTTLKASGNFPVITAPGTSTSVINRGGVSGMLIRGGGMGNTSAHGITLDWVNRMIFSDLRFHGCRHGFQFGNVWQVKMDNLHADGLGADQNYIGFYGKEVDPANQNNAVQAVNCMAQDCSTYGFRLINFNGSKFVNCEAAGGVIHGWYLGDPTTGTEQIRWGHFVNCLADTTSSHGWRLEKGSASAFQQVQFTNCWTGTSGGHGWRIAGVSQCIFSGQMVVATQLSAMHFYQTTRCTVSGSNLLGYDAANSANPGILLEASLFNVITGNHAYTTNSGKAISEIGTSDNNIAIGNFTQNDVLMIGANSRFVRNLGAGNERRGTITMPSGSTTYTVTHNLSYAPNPAEVRLSFFDNQGLATKFWTNNYTGTSFDINCNTAPGAPISIGWAIDPLRQ